MLSGKQGTGEESTWGGSCTGWAIGRGRHRWLRRAVLPLFLGCGASPRSGSWPAPRSALAALFASPVALSVSVSAELGRQVFSRLSADSGPSDVRRSAGFPSPLSPRDRQGSCAGGSRSSPAASSPHFAAPPGAPLSRSGSPRRRVAHGSDRAASACSRSPRPSSAFVTVTGLQGALAATGQDLHRQRAPRTRSTPAPGNGICLDGERPVHAARRDHGVERARPAATRSSSQPGRLRARDPDAERRHAGDRRLRHHQHGDDRGRRRSASRSSTAAGRSRARPSSSAGSTASSRSTRTRATSSSRS